MPDVLGTLYCKNRSAFCFLVLDPSKNPSLKSASTGNSSPLQHACWNLVAIMMMLEDGAFGSCLMQQKDDSALLFHINLAFCYVMTTPESPQQLWAHPILQNCRPLNPCSR